MISQVLSGFGHLTRGLSLVLTRPRLFVLGMVPPFVVSLLMGAGLLVLIFNLGDLTLLATGYADGTLREVLRVAIGIVIMVMGMLLMVITYSSITLTVGAPVYDKISELVERECGGVADPVEEKLGRSMLRAVRQSVTVLAISVGLAIPLFLIGFIPAIGGIISGIGSALVGGTMIVLELTGGTFDRRGRTSLREKYALTSARRLQTLGFGIPVFWLFSLPLVSVVAFPAAIAGATLLARGLVGESTEVASRRTAPARPGV
ncbi:EI24 domain-containing protein [Propionibacteriaceae bacterium Y2011]|uniref:EI24 domain-containing protein n=1 Tax=Microlunatus sp. Y2014 TaxID=3418488 RepID=UPI003B4E4F01